MLNNLLFSGPFKRTKLKWYFGKVAIGTPYFLPRKWIDDANNTGYLKSVPKKVGFDFVKLGWKTKWEDDDYRFEFAPLWSFVFFKWQIAVFFQAPEQEHYWECWLYYTRDTDDYLSIEERLVQAKKGFPCKWNSSKDGIICYWDRILKEKYK